MRVLTDVESTHRFLGKFVALDTDTLPGGKKKSVIMIKWSEVGISG